MKVLYPITLDVKKTNVQKHIRAFTSEGGTRELIITLVSGNDTIELTNEYVVSVVGVKPDGTEFANTAEVQNGKIHYTLTTQNVAVEGEVDCHIRVVKTNELLYTSKFAIDVEKNLSDEETETSSNEWTELINALNRVNNMSVIWSGEGAPSTDPEEYPDIQESNFYFDETNKEFYYAKAVSTTVTWDKIVDYTTLVTELATKQDELTAGDGIDITSDTVSVDLKSSGSYLDFSSGKLGVDIVTLGVSGLRQELANVSLTSSYPPLTTKTYVDNEFSKRVVKSSSLPPEQSATEYVEGTLWVCTTAPYHSYLLTKKTSSTPNYIYAWLDLGDLITSETFETLLDNTLQSIVSDGLDYDSETGLSVWLDSASSNLLSFNSSGALTLSGDTVAADTDFKTELADYVYTETEVDTKLADKQNKLTAGANITIDSNNVISATGGSGGSYTAGDGIDITNNVISVGLASNNSYLAFSNNKLTLDYSTLGSSPYFRLLLANTSTQNPLQPKLTAGTNITIDSNNVISASGGGLSYTFTNGLTESSGTVGINLKSGTELQITNDQLDIDLTDYATQTDLSSKQDTIDSTHKLDADLVDDTNSSNKFVSATEKSNWNAKADTTDIPTNVSELQNDSGYQTSADVQSAIADKQDKTDISTDTTSTTVSLTLADNHEYRYTQDLTSLTLTMPNGDFISSVVFASGSTPTSMTYDSNIKWSGTDVTSNSFVPQANQEYEIVFWYNGLSVNAVVRGVA